MDDTKKPFDQAVGKLLQSIQDGTYPPGSRLPPQRDLAKQLGVTRPTLREALQRLASEGWIRIRHGKPTMVNDYWKTGGLALLRSITERPETLTSQFVVSLLEVRRIILVDAAKRAFSGDTSEIVALLDRVVKYRSDEKNFSSFDWSLQQTIARHSGNPVYSLILNDFAGVFSNFAPGYFAIKSNLIASQLFYERLRDSLVLREGDPVAIFDAAMTDAILRYKELLNQ